MLAVVPVLGAIKVLHDNFFPNKDFTIINWIPPLPWYAWTIIILLLLLIFLQEGGYRVHKKAESEIKRLSGDLLDLKTPKFTVLFDPSVDIRPTEINPAKGLTDKVYSTQYVIRVMMESIEGIQEFEACCEEFQIVTTEPVMYSVTLGGGTYPRTLCCGDPMPVGILKELVEKDYYGNVKNKRIEIQAYSRLPPGPFEGKEFAITIRVQGLKTTSVSKRYQFGDREGKFYFEEVSLPC